MRTGFFYAGSEIYNGLANSWDYGPLGAQLKNNLKNLWWNYFITEEKRMIGIDSSILLNPAIWKASGHLENFMDYFFDCLKCKHRFKVNTGTTKNEILKYNQKNDIECPECKSKSLSDLRLFNLLFETSQGIIENNKQKLYLRPETAQGIFVNFKNIQRTSRMKLPFGVGQIGKSFRNEITPGNFIFRTREFEQMEIEFFYHPDSKVDWFKYFVDKYKSFLKIVGIKDINYEILEHKTEKLAHYSKKTVDFEYKFSFGQKELLGIADRGDFDLKNHQKHSKTDLTYLDENNNKIIPYVIEPSVGVDRLIFAIIEDNYTIEKTDDNSQRIVLKLNSNLAPYQIAILPLYKKFTDKCNLLLWDLLSKKYRCNFDETSSIGKRYRRQDEIGTNYCITYDFESLNDDSVTIRDRDTMKQIRIKIKDILSYFSNKL